MHPSLFKMFSDLLTVFTLLHMVTCYDVYTTDKKFIRNYSNLTEIPDDIPEEALEVDLSNNLITIIHPNAFVHIPDCKVLELSYNDIEKLETGAFNGLESLEKLYLYTNRLTELKTGTFSGLNTVTVLEMSENRIYSIENGAFTDLNAVKKLYLVDNALTEVRNNMFLGLDSLEELLLSRNQIGSTEAGAFNGLSKVTKLFFDDNVFTELTPNMFSGLDSLHEIILSRNKIQFIQDGAFSGLSALRKLWLDGNILTQLGTGMFLGLDELEHLSLNINRLTSVTADIFRHLVNLEYLDLDDNAISEIPSGTFQNKLQTIWLYNNKLPTLASDSFTGLPRRLNMTIGANPLQCDSRLCWIQQGEREGWIHWLQYEDRVLVPQCSSGVAWNILTLDCSGEEPISTTAPTPTTMLDAPDSSGDEDDLQLILIIVGVVLVTVVITVTIMICLKSRGVIVCYKEPSKNDVEKSDGVPAKVRYDNDRGTTNVNPGFVNATAPPAGDDDDYTSRQSAKLQRQPSDYLEPTRGYLQPQQFLSQTQHPYYLTPVHHPEFSPQDSCPYEELNESKMYENVSEGIE